MKVCRELETKYQLIPAITNDSQLTDDELLPLSKLVPLDYRQNDLKKELVHIVMENASDPRLQSHPVVS